MRNLKFTNKKEYLQYRKDWKNEYKQLTETIRDLKWMRKEYSRAASYAWINTKGKFPDMYICIKEYLNQQPRHIYLTNKYKGNPKWIEDYKKDATIMLEDLKLAKQEAQRQYLLSKITSEMRASTPEEKKDINEFFMLQV